MRTLLTYSMVFPRRSAYVLIALLAAGIAEGLSLTALLPLLSIAIGDTGDTDIGKGVNAAINMIADPNNCSNRAIINVSGDGIQSISAQRRFEITLADARKRAANLGIVINGLAIEDEVPKLAQYYHDNVISGPGSFVMNIQDFTTFATAIEEKLKKEINPVVLSSLDSQP